MLMISTLQQPIATTDTEWSAVASQPKEIMSGTRAKLNKSRSDRYDLTIPDWFEFQHLVGQWHRERGVTSSISKMATCPSYQRIIAHGRRFLPLILRQLEIEGDEPDQWFWALGAITGADPVPEEARGDIVQMSRAWQAWVRQNG